MNLLSNVTLLTAGIGGVTAAIELARQNNYIGAIIAGVIGLAAVALYELFPPTTVK